jgi:hypothetical protein
MIEDATNVENSHPDAMSTTETTTEDDTYSDEWLSDAQMEMVFFIERYHAMQGEVPDDEVLSKRFNLVIGELGRFKKHPLVEKSMKFRGINYPPAEYFFTDRQMHAIATMTNYTDRRSDEKKLRDAGITAREWATWLLDERFQRYLTSRSERMLAGAQHEAHLGLIKGMRNGNVASVKLFNEMTGRYNPEADNQVNIKMLLHRFIEILQRHIKDPVVLHGIASELAQAASREQLGMAQIQDPIAGPPPGRSAPVRVIAVKGEI